jgi:hypothetical protein
VQFGCLVLFTQAQCRRHASYVFALYNACIQYVCALSCIVHSVFMLASSVIVQSI